MIEQTQNETKIRRPDPGSRAIQFPKTLFLFLWLFITASAYAFTPIKIDSVHYMSMPLVQNSFASLRLGAATWRGSDCNPVGNYRDFNAMNFNYGLSVGKWVTHSFGIRLSYDANPANSYIQGRHIMQEHVQFLYDEDPQPDANDYYRTSFPFLYFGFGAGFVHDKAMCILSKQHNYELTTNFGAQISSRASKYICIDASVNGAKMRHSIDMWGNEFKGTVDGKYYEPGNDYNYTITLGVYYYFQGIRFKRL